MRILTSAITFFTAISSVVAKDRLDSIDITNLLVNFNSTGLLAPLEQIYIKTHRPELTELLPQLDPNQSVVLRRAIRHMECSAILKMDLTIYSYQGEFGIFRLSSNKSKDILPKNYTGRERSLSWEMRDSTRLIQVRPTFEELLNILSDDEKSKFKNLSAKDLCVLPIDYRLKDPDQVPHFVRSRWDVFKEEWNSYMSSVMLDATRKLFKDRVENIERARPFAFQNDCWPYFNRDLDPSSQPKLQKFVFLMDGLGQYRGETSLKAKASGLYDPVSEVNAFGAFTGKPSILTVVPIIYNFERGPWPDFEIFHYSQDEWVQGGVSKAASCAEKLASERYIIDEKEYRPTLVFVGFSNGGRAAIEVSNILARKGLQVDLLATIDAVEKGPEILASTLTFGLLKSNVFLKRPENIRRSINFYQTHSFLHGNPITDADRNEKLDSSHESADHMNILHQALPEVIKEIDDLPVGVEVD